MPLDPNQTISSFQARESKSENNWRCSSAPDWRRRLSRYGRRRRRRRRHDDPRRLRSGLADLQINSASDDLSRDELARLVLATSEHAQARLAEQVSTIMPGMYSASSSTAVFITDAYSTRYPALDDGEEQR
ncbi:hypothetical protein [Actinoplanes friuliensis]|uniref:Uncharacterized protein n=1 Tax=Actinoplanes friuliensis DSM 7358 TaxID=1246995 RepID=U5VW41_9ACTN|nr:hypothetical protein [Actinoplanes friuliensis]AGZ39950.1 hypothetical protein AFR_08305 [Actinoplanes friuliensis DSM 7358]